VSPFIITLLIALTLLTFVPGIITFLPMSLGLIYYISASVDMLSFTTRNHRAPTARRWHAQLIGDPDP
jgi:hypothetical protein